jgi:hypothetical protein
LPASPLLRRGVLVENPAFDVTPAKYVTAIITERGVARAAVRRIFEETGPAVRFVNRLLKLVASDFADFRG